MVQIYPIVVTMEHKKSLHSKLDFFLTCSFSIQQISCFFLGLFFYGMINIACVNAYVIYSHTCQEKRESIPPRRIFLQDVALEQICPFATEKYITKGMHLDTQFFIRSIFKTGHVEPVAAASVPSKPSRCVICPPKKDVKTKLCCISCKKTICAKHLQQVCNDCLNGCFVP